VAIAAGQGLGLGYKPTSKLNYFPEDLLNR
jgi:hypothetical protein